MAAIKYIKISKIDGNGLDLTSTLESLTKIILPLSTGSQVFNVLTSNEYTDYFLFGVQAPNNDDIPTVDKALVEEYVFTGSMDTSTYTVSQTYPYNAVRAGVIIPVETVNEDNMNFAGSGSWRETFQSPFEPVNNLYYIPTLPQKDLTVKLQGTLTTIASINLPVVIQVRAYLPNQSSGVNQLIISYSTSDTATGPINLQGTLSKEFFTPGSFIAVTINGDGGQIGPRTVQFGVDTKLLIGSAIDTPNPTSLIIEPFLTSKFKNSDCDVLQGEVEGERLNPFLQDVDYSTSQTVPVNVISLISGSATRATVPESFYTQLTSITPRYLGAKNQSEKINVWTSSSLNIGNYGNTSPIEMDSVNIFEFAWGGGTTPEILGWGGMKMSNILQVNTTSSVRVINKTADSELKLYDDYRFETTSEQNMLSYRRTSELGPDVSIRTIPMNNPNAPLYVWQVSQSRGEFYTTLNNVVPINTKIQIGSYGINQADNPIIPPSTKIAALGFAAPGKSNFMITSSYDQGPVTSQLTYDSNGNLITSIYLVPELSGSWGTVKVQQPHLLISTWNSNISRVKRNQDGFYQAGSFVKLTYKKFLNEINTDLTNGDRWFITLFQELESAGTTGDLDDALLTGSTLVPFNPGYDQKDENGNYPYPLANRGVYEIVGTDPSFSDSYDMNPVFMILSPPIKFTIPSSSFYCIPNGAQPIPSNAVPCSSTTQKVHETNVMGPYHQINIGQSKSTTNNQHPGSPTNGLGMLMWKAVGKGQLTGEDYVLIQDPIGGVGQGYFTTEFLPEEINNHIEQITKEFGLNKT